MDVERGASGPKRVVVMRHGRAEQRHHGVADVLVNGAAVTDDHAVGQRREPRHEIADLLGIEGLRERCEVAEVGEQDRHLTPLAGVRRATLGRLLCSRRAHLGHRR